MSSFWAHDNDGSPLCGTSPVTLPGSNTESHLSHLAHTYYKARGIDPQGRPSGKKLLEECGELIEAIAIDKRYDIWCEIADVAIALSYIAAYNDITIEECIKIKTAKDKGRG